MGGTTEGGTGSSTLVSQLPSCLRGGGDEGMAVGPAISWNGIMLAIAMETAPAARSSETVNERRTVTWGGWGLMDADPGDPGEPVAFPGDGYDSAIMLGTARWEQSDMARRTVLRWGSSRGGASLLDLHLSGAAGPSASRPAGAVRTEPPCPAVVLSVFWKPSTPRDGRPEAGSLFWWPGDVPDARGISSPLSGLSGDGPEEDGENGDEEENERGLLGLCPALPSDSPAPPTPNPTTNPPPPHPPTPPAPPPNPGPSVFSAPGPVPGRGATQGPEGPEGTSFPPGPRLHSPPVRVIWGPPTASEPTSGELRWVAAAAVWAWRGVSGCQADRGVTGKGGGVRQGAAGRQGGGEAGRMAAGLGLEGGCPAEAGGYPPRLLLLPWWLAMLGCWT